METGGLSTMQLVRDAWFAAHTNVDGSNLHRSGSPTTPSVTPTSTARPTAAAAAQSPIRRAWELAIEGRSAGIFLL